MNLGGGFPGQYIDGIASMSAYDAIKNALHRFLGPEVPAIAVEPGRYLVADAGVLRGEVVLVAFPRGTPGLPRCRDLQRPRRSARRGDPVPRLRAAPRWSVRARRACAARRDSIDVLYEQHTYELPLALAPGDNVDFLSTGAYLIATYSTVGFNGLPPLAALPRRRLARRRRLAVAGRCRCTGRCSMHCPNRIAAR